MLRKINSVIGKETYLCLFSALLLILSFPNFNIELLAWVGLVPLLFALKNKSKGKAFLLGYFTGIIFWSGIIYWLVHVTVAGMILLVLYLSLYFGLFALIISGTDNRKPITQVFFLPAVWVILEYTRGNLLTGFPWTLLAHSQYLNLPFIQIADITGAWGVSFMVMMVNVVVYSFIGYGLSGIEVKKYIIPGLVLSLAFGYGFYKIQQESGAGTPLAISVIQGNIPQELKWETRAKEIIFKKFLRLTAESAKERTDLLIWPEAALPVVLQDEPEFFERVKSHMKSLNKPLLLGAVTASGYSYYNSAILVSKDGEFLKKYDKIHLVPFGEYIPLRKAFPILESIVPIGDFSRGKEFTIFSLNTDSAKNARFGSLICFEDLFPGLSREFVKKGADFLVNITNDAWFQKTSSPYQHLQSSVMRAVENRVPLVRSANTGVSAFISASGKIISKVHNAGKDIYVDGHKTAQIYIKEKHPSFYTRYGDVFILLCAVYAVFYFFALRPKSDLKNSGMTK